MSKVSWLELIIRHIHGQKNVWSANFTSQPLTTGEGHRSILPWGPFRDRFPSQQHHMLRHGTALPPKDPFKFISFLISSGKLKSGSSTHSLYYGVSYYGPVAI
ncbi:hypothetical protein ACROYT_G001048 [Oculina patagonica]